MRIEQACQHCIARATIDDYSHRGRLIGSAPMHDPSDPALPDGIPFDSIRPDSVRSSPTHPIGPAKDLLLPQFSCIVLTQSDPIRADPIRADPIRP